MRGSVIALMAPSRAGKTFLTERLAEHYGAPALYEVEGALPDEVLESIKTKTNPLLGWMYFRNRSVTMQAEATELSQTHDKVFMDVSWVNNPPYIEFYANTDAERRVLEDVVSHDAAILPWPDLLIHITLDDAATERLWRSSNKGFEQGEEYYRTRLLPLKRRFERYVESAEPRTKIIEVDRSNLDWANNSDLKILTDKIDSALSG